MAARYNHTAGKPAFGMSQENLVNLEGAQTKKQRSPWKPWAIIGGVALIVIAAVVIAVLASQGIIDTGNDEADSALAEESTTSTLTSSVVTDSPEPTSTLDEDDDNEPTSTSSSASSSKTSSSKTSSSVAPTSTGCTPSDEIPKAHRNTELDPSTWFESDGLNCTFTSATVGDLPVMGLFSSWDDSARANPDVPALNKPWGSYASRPARGVNLGGWLSLEPFITPSLFEPHIDDGVVDEYSLCKTLGSKARETLEKHYATFITEADFKAIAAAGLDHIRIPFSYWAVETYDDDPFVERVSWRYLIRGIEWARKYGLRVKLDVHGLPGSQNGWNHSGRSGDVNWIAGADGEVNRKRSLDMHDRLSKFFAQPRYRNVVAFYGQANEPGHDIPKADIIEWTAEVHEIVTNNGIRATQVFGEAFKGLTSWQGDLQGYGDSLAVDAHQYLIFNDGLLAQSHAEKITFVCSALTEQSELSSSKSTGFGPTIIGEWSQADTDCTTFLNGVGNGARWSGTFMGDGSTPGCPTGDSKCSCDKANEDAGKFSDEYKMWLKTFAEAQMDAYERTWGWFYWTWRTEDAAGWSYKHGLDHGFMPEKANERAFKCGSELPDFGNLPEWY